MLHELPDFELFTPSTLAEAIEVLGANRGRAKILAGGTDLLGLMKDRISGPQMPMPEVLVSVRRIADLRSVSHDDSNSSIGAAVTLSEIAGDATLSHRFPALVQGARSVGTNQIRNMGTLGGNLCQRPWCWYFRHPAFECFKKGGELCYAITGENSTYFSVYDLGVCVMAHPSDTAPALMVLDAEAEILGPDGARRVPMAGFFLGPREVQENVVAPDEILVRVAVPKTDRRSVYLKQRVRNNWDFALASVAASAQVEDGALSSVSMVLGGVAPRPQRLEGVDEMVADGLGEASKARLGRALKDRAHPLRLNRYKTRVISALAIRALESLSGERSSQ